MWQSKGPWEDWSFLVLLCMYQFFQVSGSGLHMQYQQLSLTGMQIQTTGSFDVPGGIQLTNGSGTPLQTTQILNPRLQPTSTFPSQLLLQTPSLGE